MLVYDGARLRAGGSPTPAGRRAVQAELARALLDGPGHRRVHGRLRGPVRRRPGHRGVRRADRRAAASGAAGRRPLRQARRQRPGVERAGEARAARPRRRSPTTTPTTSSPWSRRPGSGPATRSPRRSTSSTPAGAAQIAHRDYHLGFMSHEQSPSASRRTCTGSRPLLTLQGAVAHCDMPVETGPTMYLPHSQKYEPGYLACRRPEFRELLRAPTTSSCRWPRATPRSSTRPCSTAPAPTARGRPPDGQPAAGLLGVRPGHGERRPGRGCRTRSSRRCSRLQAAGADAAALRQRRRRRAPRATRSRPTSTATSRSTAWHRRPRPTCSAARCTRAAMRPGSTRSRRARHRGAAQARTSTGAARRRPG